MRLRVTVPVYVEWDQIETIVDHDGDPNPSPLPMGMRGQRSRERRGSPL